MIIFAGVMAVTAYVILNLEFPRVGFGHLRRARRVSSGATGRDEVNGRQ